MATIKCLTTKQIGLIVVLTITSVQSQSTIANPQVRIATCNALQCGTAALCASIDRPYGVGIAPQAVIVPNNSASNLSLTLTDDFPQYQFGDREFTTQRLLVGAPSDLALQTRPPGCALLFQNRAQTFPGLENPDNQFTTLCGNGLNTKNLEPYARFIREFDLAGQFDVQTRNDSATPACEALANHLLYRAQQRDATLGDYYSDAISITGGAIAGSALNTSDMALNPLYRDCKPVVPSQYKLYNVLTTGQVLDRQLRTNPRFGGRNGTTPIVTVMLDEDGSANLQLFCLQQFASAGGDLPVQSLGYLTNAAESCLRTPFIMMVLCMSLAIANSFTR